ncbi:putative prolyl-tRNA synthetase [Selenomonas ruminantium subsp. lactilytica TAM6421]|uniref:Proline--tRNA ligase n=1 Tax=Selenomonas ruminantium subsp. lactilytica (strain NBRC 103574 / TAM6421) TaxID=927704 RepID=I0GNH8_SELRL|nr:proline--tRNA ligase [Selenomonas ruminantium]BAL82315.1 putative prolyl-tRNA synthetase [Selenomonas ruminantium subsp. lactilytica TAM6421]
MRASNLYAPTLRNTPAEAEIASHQLMYRAGMIRKVAGGMYTYLPLGWRVIRKIEEIIREEMDAAGGQEIGMPILQPSELWEESGRWAAYGDEMMRIKDRHGRNFCLGPTHEEMITDLVRDEVSSYKQLPLMLYQIQDKFRDERRPRFGLMRSREFIMKDLYSFDKDVEGMNVSYQKMYDAYTNIYTRMGLEFRPVEADNGAIGGGHSHEFTVLAEAGESNIAYCSKCDYAASDEKAALAPIEAPAEEELPLEKVATPGANTIEALAQFLNIPMEKTIKAVAYQSDNGKLVLAFVRGDHDVNEVKVINQVEGALELTMAEDEAIMNAGGCPGFMSAIGIKPGEDVIVLVDPTVMNMHNAVAGANEVDAHYKNVNPQRDFNAEGIIVTDLRMVKEGDACPHCGAELKMTRGIEAGQVFTLGTKYSQAMGAMFLDEQGKQQPLYMGCYGIGVGRTMAAAIEQNNDENGIIWPRAIAPFEVVVVAVNAKKEDQLAYSEEIYKECKAAGIDTLLDDRKERAGVKFKDCDLIGYPLRVVVGPKAVEEGQIEIKVRKTGEMFTVSRDEYLAKVQEILATL